jgi:DNA-binding response OmpR family regulator
VLNRERVLVVDEVSDTAEVLQAVLEPRGLTVNRVRRLELAAPAANGNRPAVLILDAESLNCASPALCGGWQNVPQVIIGTVRVVEEMTDPVATRRFLRKPFQFAELVQAIESLIGGEPRVV